MNWGAPANLSETESVVWPLSQRIVLDDCALDAMRLKPRGVMFEKTDVLAADSLVAVGLLVVTDRRYFCTRKGWDALGASIFRT